MGKPSRSVDVQRLDSNFKVASGSAGLENISWHSPASAASPVAEQGGGGALQVAGLAWFDQERLYRRLPRNPSEPFTPAVDSLADAPAGGQIRFRTDSPRIAVRVQLSGPANMPHMPSTGQCGVDCYVGEPLRQRYAATARYDHKQDVYELLLVDLKSPEMRDITLNLPLYQGVQAVEVGLERQCELQPPRSYADGGRVVVYGSSITQGGCASRPGMCYTNILSRRFDCEFINLGFSGNGHGHPEVARAMAAIDDVALFVLDYDANMANAERLAPNLPVFIDILRQAHPSAQILVVSRIRFACEQYDPKEEKLRLTKREVQRDVVERLRSGGDSRIVFLDGGTLLGENWDECTVDGIHPTDLGFLRMADSLEPVLRKILQER